MHPRSDQPVELRPKTDEELWQALGVDQTAALGALYDRYAGLVYGLSLKILTSHQEAEDLTQEVFLTFCNKCDYDPARGSLSGFLINITRSRAIDKLRSRRRRLKFLEHWGQTTLLEVPSCNPLEWLSLTECCQKVRNALDQLPDNQRQALEMAYYKGLSQTEIAGQLDAPLGTVKTWTRKGLLSLKHMLQDLVQ